MFYGRAKTAFGLGLGLALVGLQGLAPESVFAKSPNTTKVTMNVGGIDVTTVVETDESADSNEIEDAPASAPAAAKTERKAMGPLDFERLTKNIKDEKFDDDQLRVIRMAAQRNYFSCQQVGALIDLVSFDDGKIEVVKLTRTRIVDVKNVHTVLSHFDYDSSKEEAQKLLAGI